MRTAGLLRGRLVAIALDRSTRADALFACARHTRAFVDALEAVGHVPRRILTRLDAAPAIPLHRFLVGVHARVRPLQIDTATVGRTSMFACGTLVQIWIGSRRRRRKLYTYKRPFGFSVNGHVTSLHSPMHSAEALRRTSS